LLQTYLKVQLQIRRVCVISQRHVITSTLRYHVKKQTVTVVTQLAITALPDSLNTAA